MTVEFPPIYLLPTHTSHAELHELEDKITTLTHDITEATIVLGKVATKARALFELRSRQLWTEEVAPRPKSPPDHTDQSATNDASSRVFTRDDIFPTVRTAAEEDLSVPSANEQPASHNHVHAQEPTSLPVDRSLTSASHEVIKVVKLSWFIDSLAAGKLLSLSDYLVYEGRISPRDVTAVHESSLSKKRPRDLDGVLLRAKDDAPVHKARPFSAPTSTKRPRSPTRHSVTRPTQLLHQTTSEHEHGSKLPPLPDELNCIYSCQRSTPLYSPNDSFILQLKEIKLARVLLEDEIGVRAYSTSIASLAAYPYTLTSVQEILRLPGCDQKIAALYQEWKDSGQLAVVQESQKDPRMTVLRLFYEIWGVGAKTAREFYDKGWRDLDDVVEYGWKTLSRVQQIGVKYYDEFQQKIPRKEVERIGNVILACANTIETGFEMVVVGGYRRGKSESGDVDVVLSHPRETTTSGIVQQIVIELEKQHWITHTLTLSTANSERGQMPVAWKGDTKGRTGFDTLDKALVVWQDPLWPDQAEDVKRDSRAKNPNIHRRVDIIISPWKTAGCAVMGWTSGTTFQRDLRRFANKEKNLKFDSSGIRSREDGHWVDLEAPDDTRDLVEKEKRVFAGLGLPWREPTERCTG